MPSLNLTTRSGGHDSSRIEADLPGGRRARRTVRTEVVAVLALCPSSGLRTVDHDGSERTDRKVLMAIESEYQRAVGAVTDDGEGDNRHTLLGGLATHSETNA
jgi:hypothetical protein